MNSKLSQMPQSKLLAMSLAANGIAGATVLGATKLAGKISGKPQGMPGSIAHVLTNDKIENKGACYVAQLKEGAKDTLKLTAATGAAAGVASLAAGFSPKVQAGVKNIISKAGEGLAKVSVNGQSLKDTLKNSPAYGWFKALPSPAKAAVLAGAAVLSLGAFVALTSNKPGYIEGQHETK